MVLKSFLILCALFSGVYQVSVTVPSDMRLEPAVFSPISKPDHVVIVIEENHSSFEIIDNPLAPYINSLRDQGANFTKVFAVDRPSQPNYLDLFSGANQGINDDSCPHTFSTGNLGSNLLKAGYTFMGYSEDLPNIGYTGCLYKKYARKHSPWVNFLNIPSSKNVPFTHFPFKDFNTLPTVSFVIPNLDNDMHDGTISQADNWLKENMDAYVQWAKKNNSLFILTWDEGGRLNNHIPTIFVGGMVKPGVESKKPITHFNMLRTLEDMYGLPYVGKSGGSTYPITGIWK